MKSVARFLASIAVALMIGQAPARASTSVSLPPPLDQDALLVERYWAWLKDELDAPANFPSPRIEIAPLPRTVRMAFIFPTEKAPWREMRIVLSPRSVDRAAGTQRLEVIGELAHEMVHYIMVLAENGWNSEAATFRNDIHHHCDPEFMRLSRQIAHFLWETYHSNDAVRSVDHNVNLACWRDGHNIGSTRSR